MARWGWQVEGEGADWSPREGNLRGCDCCEEGLNFAWVLRGEGLMQFTFHRVAVEKGVWRGTGAEDSGGGPARSCSCFAYLWGWLGSFWGGAMTGFPPPHHPFEGEESWLTSWVSLGLGAYILPVMGWPIKWVWGLTRAGVALLGSLLSSKAGFPGAPCQAREN